MKKEQKILEILDLFTIETRELTVSEMAEKLDQPQSSVYRSVRALKEKKYLEETSNGYYKLGYRFLHFAALVRMDNDLITIVHPHLKRLTKEIGETSMITKASGLYSVCLDVAASGQFLQITTLPGKIFPLYGGASSKILLAYMPEETVDMMFDNNHIQPFTNKTILDKEVMKRDLAKIREQGYAFSSGEFEEGLSAFAVPIRNMDNNVIAGLSIVGLDERVQQLDHAFVVEKLKETAQLVQKYL